MNSFMETYAEMQLPSQAVSKVVENLCWKQIPMAQASCIPSQFSHFKLTLRTFSTKDYLIVCLPIHVVIEKSVWSCNLLPLTYVAYLISVVYNV